MLDLLPLDLLCASFFLTISLYSTSLCWDWGGGVNFFNSLKNLNYLIQHLEDLVVLTVQNLEIDFVTHGFYELEGSLARAVCLCVIEH